MGAKEDLIDGLKKLSMPQETTGDLVSSKSHQSVKDAASQGLDAIKNSVDDWAISMTDIISQAVTSLIVSPGLIVDQKTTNGIVIPGEKNLTQVLLTELGTSSAMKGLMIAANQPGSTDIINWASDFSTLIATYCTSTGIAANTFITIAPPGIPIPTPPIPVIDLIGAIVIMSNDYIGLETKDADDAIAKAGLSAWATSMVSAISVFLPTLVVPAAAGYSVIAPPPIPPGPPVIALPNIVPIPIEEKK